MAPGHVTLGIRVSTAVINLSRDKKTKLIKPLSLFSQDFKFKGCILVKS